MNVYKKTKKSAFITLEIIAITIMILSVTGMITSISINNLKKAECYQIEEDVRSISLEYENAILAAEEFINSSVEIKDNIKKKIINEPLGEDVPKFIYIYKYDKNTSISIVIKDVYIRLEQIKTKTIKKVNLKAKIINERDEEEIILIPQYYKTDFINI